MTNTNDIEAALRRAYLLHDGTVEGFEVNKANLIAQYRNQATISAALAEANQPPSLNDVIRAQLADRRDADVVRLLSREGAA